MRILQLSTTLEHIVPALSRRLSGTYLDGARTAFALQTDIGAMGLRCTEKGVTLCDPSDLSQNVLVIPQHRLMQLIIGYTDPGRILSRPEVTVPPGLAEWIERLFPKQCPFFWDQDHF